MDIDDIVEGVERVGLLTSEDIDAFADQGGVVSHKEVATDAGDCTQDTFVAAAIGRVDIDSVFDIDGASRRGEVFKPVTQRRGNQNGWRQYH